MEEEISRLQNLIRTAEVVSEEDISTETVSIGTVVTVLKEGTKDKKELTIVGSEEADPWNNMISTDSGVGKALLGARVGEKRTVDLPRGNSVTYVVKKIAHRK